MKSCVVDRESPSPGYSEELLSTMDFPDAVTGVLRRTTDIVRGILEKTRGDLTLSLRQRDPEVKLPVFETKWGITPTESAGKEAQS